MSVNEIIAIQHVGHAFTILFISIPKLGDMKGHNFNVNAYYKESII